MINIDYNNLIKDLEYNKDTGYFYWVNPRPGRPKDKPAGTKTHHGYWIINYNGNKILTHRLAFFYMNGTWPNSMVGFKDKDPSNCSWDNLYLKTDKQHYDGIKETIKNKEKKAVDPLQPVVRKRSTFNNKEAHQAVEEFIKDKILVEGVYIVRDISPQTSSEEGVSQQAS